MTQVLYQNVLDKDMRRRFPGKLISTLASLTVSARAAAAPNRRLVSLSRLQSTTTKHLTRQVSLTAVVWKGN